MKNIYFSYNSGLDALYIQKSVRKSVVIFENI